MTYKHDDGDEDIYAWLRDPEPDAAGTYPYGWAILIMLAIWAVGMYAVTHV